MVSVSTQLCHWNIKAATDTEMNRSSCVPKKLYLEKQMRAILTLVCQPLLYIQEIHNAHLKKS